MKRKSFALLLSNFERMKKREKDLTLLFLRRAPRQTTQTQTLEHKAKLQLEKSDEE
jgi:hypothetical protein